VGPLAQVVEASTVGGTSGWFTKRRALWAALFLLGIAALVCVVYEIVATHGIARVILWWEAFVREMNG